MFDRVLIANRGEIAVRIIRTLHRLGVCSIAVFSDADRHARHVADADLAVHIGPAAAAQSYLSVERIVDAAVRTGAQALHPGYGFLSENVRLAAACAEAGIAFIGPPVAAIEAMGDKIRAKATVSANGVRVVPGVSGAGLAPAELVEAASTIGLPALIKPSAGGGGKGMRVVRDTSEWGAAIASAQREARAAFGDDTLLIERYVERPRHIEVQVLADAHGNVVHLGERECTLQRRHQKVIEEAPSPYLDDGQRAALGAQAVAAARACGYVNAGTVEFVVSGERPDEAYFLEMNTRLQVEHPITELVWGVDLVEQQLRIAAGQPLPFTQADLVPDGHAFEARVYAEDPAAGFLPTGGTVELLAEPYDRPHVRIDSSLLPGTVIGADYDPMLSKVIAWGPTRDAARLRLDAALGDTVVLGVTTNVAFLRRLLADPAVARGEMDTGLIDRIPTAELATPTPPSIAIAAALAMLESSATAGPWGARRGWRTSEPASLVLRLVDAGHQRIDVRLRASGDSDWEASVGEQTWWARSITSGDRLRLALDGTVEELAVVARPTGVWLGRGGASWQLSLAPEQRGGRAADPLGDLTIASPMPGTVVTVDVAVGDRLRPGDPVAVVEAMKMEHTLRAAHAASVREVLVAPGDRVALRQPLVLLDDDGG